MAGAKKAPAKKSAAKKSTAKKATPVKKAAPAKKAVAKKAAPKKAAPVKKAAPAKKAVAKKAAPKKVATKTAAPVEKAAPAKQPPYVRQPVPAKKPALKKSPYDKRFLDQQRELLNEERATYARQAEHLQAEADELAAQREPGDVQFDEESGEGDTLAVERERDLAMSAQARAMIEEIDAALERMAAGMYGICEVSGQSIPKERLKAIPWARERVEYKVGGFARR